MMDRADEFDLSFPTKQLASAPIHSDLGGDYLGAMACAANVAYANRQMVTHSVRAACDEFFEHASVELDPEIVYDITHNLARFESVENREHLVHRKGAVRALPADHSDNPEVYGDVGHPVMVPGNMGTGTYVLQAGERITDTYFSINHGAGRQMSRTQAKEEISEEMLLEALGDVQLLGASRKKIRDEAPQAYKNIRNVIDVLTDANIASTVAHLKPLVVIKGE
jgi:tRNA-splicing ligase RtcB